MQDNGNQQQIGAGAKKVASKAANFLKKIIKLLKQKPWLKSVFVTIGTISLKVIGILCAVIFVVVILYTIVDTIVSLFTFEWLTGDDSAYIINEDDDLETVGMKIQNFIVTFIKNDPEYGIDEKTPEDVLVQGDKNKYNELSLEGLEETFSGGGCGDYSWLSQVWDWFIPGISSPCEFNKAIEAAVSSKEKKTGLALSRGLVLGTVLYGYVSQPLEDEEAVDIEYPTQMLNDIIDQGVFDQGDIKKMVDFQVFDEEYDYWTYVPEVLDDPDTEEDEHEDPKCEKDHQSDDLQDYVKFFIFLRYGKDVALEYEEVSNKNRGYSRTSPQCKGQGEDAIENNWPDMDGPIDTSKYLVKADPDSELEDMLGEMSYKTGYIAEKFPGYIEKSDNKFYAKNIELAIRNIDTHENDMNEVLGYPSQDDGGYFGIGGAAFIGVSGQLAIPVELNNGTVRTSSCFGWRTHPVTGARKFHSGIDLPGAKGSPIYAMTSGVISAVYEYYGNSDADCNSGANSCGTYILINHEGQANGKSLYTIYCHLSAIQPGIAVGVQVNTGQVIGAMGSTGCSTGSHLHFGVRSSASTSDSIDPYNYLYQTLFGNLPTNTTCVSGTSITQ